jgi:hypothetical protein
MNTHKVQVLEIDDILDELFGDDTDSMDQLADEITLTGWTFGDTPYTLVRTRDFHAWLKDVVDGNLVAGLYARSQLDILAPFLGEDQDVYVNLEALR